MVVGEHHCKMNFKLFLKKVSTSARSFSFCSLDFVSFFKMPSGMFIFCSADEHLNRKRKHILS